GAAARRSAQCVGAAARHFQPLVNGYSGFEPEAFRERARAWAGFPSEAVLDDMSRTGVTHVILHLGRLDGRVVREVSASPRLVLTADDGERRIYALTGR